MSSSSPSPISSDNRVYEHYQLEGIPEDLILSSPEPSLFHFSRETSQDENRTYQNVADPDFQPIGHPNEEASSDYSQIHSLPAGQYLLTKTNLLGLQFQLYFIAVAQGEISVPVVSANEDDRHAMNAKYLRILQWLQGTDDDYELDESLACQPPLESTDFRQDLVHLSLLSNDNNFGTVPSIPDIPISELGRSPQNSPRPSVELMNSMPITLDMENSGTNRPLFGLIMPLSSRCRKYLRRWIQVLLLSVVVYLVATLALSVFGSSSLVLPSNKTPCITDGFGLASMDLLNKNSSRTPVPIHRIPDTLDAFANYRYRNHTKCQISSLDLHNPFNPLCSNRAEMLTAISGGGRIGKEAPFMPRGCDMRWFTTEEICEILGRFEKVIVVGDSMMRHLVGAMNVLLRKDLGYGAVTNWNFSPKERKECFCNQQFDVKECSLQGIYKTADVESHDTDSLACGSGKIDLVIELMLKFPLDPVEVDRFKALLSPMKPSKPYAFIFGHGLWNDLDLQATVNWLDGINSHTLAAAPYLADEEAIWPRLFITPNAAGPLKPDQFILSQGDKALQIFEESVREEARERGVEHLGTWNMSIQANKFDGVHLDLRGNLIKAMAAINWLALI